MAAPRNTWERSTPSCMYAGSIWWRCAPGYRAIRTGVVPNWDQLVHLKPISCHSQTPQHRQAGKSERTTVCTCSSPVGLDYSPWLASCLKRPTFIRTFAVNHLSSVDSNSSFFQRYSVYCLRSRRLGVGKVAPCRPEAARSGCKLLLTCLFTPPKNLPNCILTKHIHPSFRLLPQVETLH